MSVNLVPFTPTEHAELSPKGYFIHAITTDYSLTLLRNEAPPLRIQKSYTPVPVAAGERAEEEAQEIRNMRGTDPNWRWNGPPIPDVKPPFQHLLPRGGRYHLGQSPPTGQESRRFVFRSLGSRCHCRGMGRTGPLRRFR